MKKIGTGIVLAGCLLALIFDGKTALLGASEGISLCLRTVVPSLFPFFVLSGCLTALLTGRKVPLLGAVGRFCGIPRGGESILAVGLLGGYPVGAQTVAQAYRMGSLSKEDARRMLGFCNNAGPAFLFGMVGCSFSGPFDVWALWGIQILSAILTAAVLPGKSEKTVVLPSGTMPDMAQVMKRSVQIMGSVCGWVVLFRVILAFLSRWFLWLFPMYTQVLIMGVLELANGCSCLAQIQMEGMRFIYASLLLSFGGVCVAMQTQSVTQGLGMGLYFPGKCIQCTISLVLAVMLAFLLYSNAIGGVGATVLLLSSGAVLTFALVRVYKKGNRTSNLQKMGV